MKEQANPRIDWYTLKNQPFIKFSFSGNFTEKDASTAVKIWKQYFESKENEKIALIWDCLAMTGYEPGSRHHWQQMMTQLKHQIEVIWLITDSKIIRVGAMLLSAFTSYSIKVVATEKQITFDIPATEIPN